MQTFKILPFHVHMAKENLKYIFFLAFIISFCIPSFSAFADAGPHPSMEFIFRYSINSTPVEESAKLIFCHDADCKINQEVMGPFRCSNNSCSYMYGSNGYYKLVVIFSDKTRESNIFQKTRFNSSYVVTVNQDNLYVTETWSGLPYELYRQIALFIVALIITLPSELLVAKIFFKRINQPYNSICIVKANLISLPIVWFVFPFILLDSFVVILLAEIFALLFEAWYIHRNDTNRISYVTAFCVSLIMNLTSFSLSVFLSMLLYIRMF